MFSLLLLLFSTIFVASDSFVLCFFVVVVLVLVIFVPVLVALAMPFVVVRHVISHGPEI